LVGQILILDIISGSQMAKKNPTVAYIQALKADAFRMELALSDTPENRHPVGRLSWNLDSYPDECSDEMFAESVEAASLPDSQFFLDTCFITGREVEPCLWVALLRKTIVITSHTLEELKPWLQTPFVNKPFRDLILEAQRVGHPAIRIENAPTINSELEWATRYYVELLGFRKKIFPIVSEQLQSELGRVPTDDELLAKILPLIQDRGLQLALKGRSAQGQDNVNTDEQVVVRSVVSAILTGRETSVLTRDRDLVEQFYKLMYLMDTQYRSVLIADAYVQQPLNFIEAPWPNNSPYFENAFISGRLMWLPKSANERFLPRHHNFVMVHVYRFGARQGQNSFTAIGFCAEREMLALLRVKDWTRGRNTSAIGIQNFHRCVGPHIQEYFGPFAAVAVDETVTSNGVSLPIVDIELALSRKERISRVAVMPRSGDSEQDEGVLTAYGWSKHRCDVRLGWSPTAEPLQTSSKQIADTLGFLPMQTEVYLDPSFLAADLNSAISDVLIKTECGTTTEAFASIRNLITPPLNSLAHRMMNKSAPPWLHVLDLEDWSTCLLSALRQYLALLVFRKQLGSIVRDQIEVAHGYIPGREEWLKNLESISGNHVLRSLDAEANAMNPDYFTEDQFVVHVVMNAIVSGSDCVILTRRKVVQQQFISLMRIMEMHYRAWAIAKYAPLLEATQAGRTKTRMFRLGIRRMGFKATPSIFEVSKAFADSCLPNHAVDLQLQCWLFDGEQDELKFIPVSFLAERPMYWMLQLRGESGGLNSGNHNGEDLQFAWIQRKAESKGLVFRGKSTWTDIGKSTFPQDSRANLQIEKLPTKDLVWSANYCDFPKEMSAYW
jgi:hypothetical protein